MTINEFFNIVDPSKPIVINSFNGDTGEIRTVVDTRQSGDIPFDVIMRPITYITTEGDAIVIEYYSNT